MTTTSNMSGLADSEKPSSRVLRPPGGGSSDIFGTASAPASAPRQQNQRNGSNIFGGPEEPSPSRAQANNSSTQSNLFGMEPHVLAGKGRNQSRGKFNPITGEPYENFDSSPAASPAAPAVTQPQQQQQQQQTASPSAAASEQTGGGDSALQAKEGKAQPTVHTSSRVLNPPGGVAHKLW